MTKKCYVIFEAEYDRPYTLAVVYDLDHVKDAIKKIYPNDELGDLSIIRGLNYTIISIHNFTQKESHMIHETQIIEVD